MFKVLCEQFGEEPYQAKCYGLLEESKQIYASAFSTSIDEAEQACEALNSAETDRENLLYILQDMVTQRHLV